jgi:glycine/D-amino acid oxidase-like deaminating enzyme
MVRLLGFSAAALPGSPLRALSHDHVIVAGAGIIGASLAYHMAKRGARVTLLEKEHPAAGTTKNSFAWLNASDKSPHDYYELNLAGIAGWRRLQLDLGSSLPVQWGGGVQWCKPDAGQVERMKAHVRERQAWGYSIGLVDGRELTHLVPGVEPGEVGAANFADQEGTVDPVAAANALVAKARALGAQVIYPCQVKDLRLGEGRIRSVVTTRGMTCAPIVGQLASLEILDQVEVDLLQPFRAARFPSIRR